MWCCTGRRMLNPVEKLLDMYGNYDHGFMSTRQNFLIINLGFISSFLWPGLLMLGAGGWWVPSQGACRAPHAAGWQGPACKREQGRRSGQWQGPLHHGPGWAMGQGAWPRLRCSRSAGLAVRGCWGPSGHNLGPFSLLKAEVRPCQASGDEQHCTSEVFLSCAFIRCALEPHCSEPPLACPPLVQVVFSCLDALGSAVYAPLQGVTWARQKETRESRP